jgi:general secretion pathway protein H
MAGGHSGTQAESRARSAGFTLIEILAVMAILALMIGFGVRGLRAATKSELRTSSAHLSGAVRYLFDRASTTGKIHRLVVDLGEGRYWAEVSDDHFYIPHEAESEEDTRKREAKEAKEDEDEQRKQEERANAESNGSSVPSSSSFDMSKLEMGDFRPKRARFAAFKELALKPVALGKNVKVRSFYTPRVTEPVRAGRAYLYFFPLGQTEPAIITLSDQNEESIYSLVVHPITGRVRIYSEEVKPPAGEQYDDEGTKVVQ